MASFKVVFFLFLPEIFIILALLSLLLFLTIITKRRPELLTYNVMEFCWFFCLAFTVFYFFLILFTPASYCLLFGIYSTHLIFSIKLFLTFCFIIYLLYLWAELQSFVFYSYEFLIVLVFSLVTLNLLLNSYSFVNIFIFLEIFGLCVYYLVASQRTLRSLEASVKYFIFGSISSIFLAFGFFLIYFSTGVASIVDLDLFSYNNLNLMGNLVYQLGCLITALSIVAKIGGGFFFYWVLDVYDGMSYPLLIFLNLFAKIVYVITLFNMVSSFNSPLVSIFIQILIISSLLFGALGALYQIKVRRFLIYTSIYNISFFSIPFWHISQEFKIIFLFFIFVYLINSLIFMILLSSLKDWTTGLAIRNIADLVNIKYQNKPIATVLSIFSFINAGLPPAALFLIKFSIFIEMSRVLNFVWVVFFLLASTLSFFYYVRLIKLILQPTNRFTVFFKPPATILLYLTIVILFFNFSVLFFFDLFYYLLCLIF